MHDASVVCGVCVSCLLADRFAGVHDGVGVFSHDVAEVLSHRSADEHGVAAVCCTRCAAILEMVFKEVCFDIISFFHSRQISVSCDCVACARSNIPIVLVVPAVPRARASMILSRISEKYSEF